jgi:hypothetical protein
MEIGQPMVVPHTIGIRGGCSICSNTSGCNVIHGKNYCDSCLLTKFGITKQEVTFRRGDGEWGEWDTKLIAQAVAQAEEYRINPTNKNLRTISNVRVKDRKLGIEVVCTASRDVIKNCICALNVFWSQWRDEGQDKREIVIEVFGSY